ncbi:MAG: hypothetical protein Q7S34_02880 [bacterium]|nr:hypothetical protein [bacterium]
MNQKGFANIVLTIVIVVIAGAVGYFALVKKSEPIAQQPTPTPTQTKTPTQTPTPNKSYLLIKEWGVEFEKPNGMSDLQYVINPKGYSQNNTVAGFTTQKLIDLDKSSGGQCSDYLIGSLSRFTDKELNYYKSPNGPGVPNYVKVGNYYYSFNTPQEACSYNKQYAELEAQQTSVLNTTVLKSLKVAP